MDSTISRRSLDQMAAQRDRSGSMWLVQAITGLLLVALLGTLAFALNRLTAIGLTIYLFLHLVVLSQLLRGPEGWNSFVAVARSPLFLTLDVVLLFGVVYHMFNGIRVALVGMGVAHRQQRGLFYGLVGLALVLFVVGAILIFTK